MNILDGGLFALIALSAIIGAMRGGTRELIGVLGWVGAIFLQIHYWDPISKAIQPYFSQVWLAKLISFVGILVGSLIAFTIISRIVSRIVKASPIKLIDNFMGLFYGALRGFALVFISFYIVLPLMRNSNIEVQMIDKSYLANKSEPSVNWVLMQIPDKIRGYVTGTIKATLSDYVDKETLNKIDKTLKAPQNEQTSAEKATPPASSPNEIPPPASPEKETTPNHASDAAVDDQGNAEEIMMPEDAPPTQTVTPALAEPVQEANNPSGSQEPTSNTSETVAPPTTSSENNPQPASSPDDQEEIGDEEDEDIIDDI